MQTDSTRRGRRGRGEGTIYARRDATGKVTGWVSQISLGWKPDGKRERKTIYGKSQSDVRIKLRALQREQDAGATLRTDERLTVGAFLQRWLDDAAHHVRPKTLTMYRLHVNRHITPHIGAARLSALTTEMCDHFLNQKLEEKLAPKTVLHLRATLRAALNRAVEWNFIPRNPALRTRPPRQETPNLRVLDLDEARRFLAVAESDRLYAVYVVALTLGLRQGEILALRWEDIDFQAQRVHVRHSLQRIDGKLELVEPKTRLSSRALKMPAMLYAALKKHQTQQRAEGIISPFVFTTWRGTPIDARNLLRDFKGLLRDAGLPRSVRFHDLRHSAATMLLGSGVNIKVLAELLGHTSPTMLLQVYSHVLPQLRDQAAAEMDALLGQV